MKIYHVKLHFKQMLLLSFISAYIYAQTPDTHIQISSRLLSPLGDTALADSVHNYHPGLLPPSEIMEKSDNPDHNFVLSIDGNITWEFKNNALVEGPGNDLQILAAWPSDGTLKAWISKHGRHFTYLGEVAQSGLLNIETVATSGQHYHYIKLRYTHNNYDSLHAQIYGIEAINGPAILNIPVKSMFEARSTDWQQDAAERINVIAQQILSYNPKRIIIEVYSDTRGDADYLTNLTQTQADLLCDKLRSACKINPLLFFAIGLGASNQIICENADDAIKLNQRIRICIDPLTGPEKI